METIPVLLSVFARFAFQSFLFVGLSEFLTRWATFHHFFQVCVDAVLIDARLCSQFALFDAFVASMQPF